MKFVFNVIDGIGDFFDALASRIKLLFSKKTRVRFLWILVGVVLVFGIADNRTAVMKILEATTGGGAQFNQAGELVEASVNGALVWIASFALTMFFLVCESNLILGFREPNEAHKRFQEANKFRVSSPSSGAPNAADHYYNALMNGELFDIYIARVVGVLAFVFDVAIQFQNRYWGGSALDTMISAGCAAWMLVGTELLILFVRVTEGYDYPGSQTQKKSGQQKESASSQKWQYAEHEGVEYRYTADKKQVQQKVNGEWQAVSA